MHALFIHGMGRTPLSALPMLARLRSAGLQTSSFGYATAFQDFAAISQRLAVRIAALAGLGPYTLIGHSLGGVLLRAALATLAPETPPPQHIFLLGSPVLPSRLARKFGGNLLFRGITSDCGELLGSAQRMAGVAPTKTRTTSIIGTKGLRGRFSPFGADANDGVVALEETRAPWIDEEVQLPLMHTLLPSSALVADTILQKLQAQAAASNPR